MLHETIIEALSRLGALDTAQAANAQVMAIDKAPRIIAFTSLELETLQLEADPVPS